MAQPLRCENKDNCFLVTTRTNGSRLWFVNNVLLWDRILAFLARYQELYGVEIYAVTIQGNHIHAIVRCPLLNKASFMRSWNSMIARLVKRHVPQFREGRFWGRRYSEQILPRPEDVKHWFFYCALNPVLAGLVRNTKSYRGYNSFWDARAGITRTFKVFLRGEYLEAKFKGIDVSPKDFIREHKLRFSRLPNMEELSDTAYKEELDKELDTRQLQAVKTFEANGGRYPDSNKVNKIVPGTFPRKTKKSKRDSYRPLVLTLCPMTRHKVLSNYFDICDKHRESADSWKQGNYLVEFPPGTYRPPLLKAA